MHLQRVAFTPFRQPFNCEINYKIIFHVLPSLKENPQKNPKWTKRFRILSTDKKESNFTLSTSHLYWTETESESDLSFPQQQKQRKRWLWLSSLVPATLSSLLPSASTISWGLNWWSDWDWVEDLAFAWAEPDQKQFASQGSELHRCKIQFCLAKLALDSYYPQ